LRTPTRNLFLSENPAGSNLSGTDNDGGASPIRIIRRRRRLGVLRLDAEVAPTSECVGEGLRERVDLGFSDSDDEFSHARKVSVEDRGIEPIEDPAGGRRVVVGEAEPDRDTDDVLNDQGLVEDATSGVAVGPGESAHPEFGAPVVSRHYDRRVRQVLALDLAKNRGAGRPARLTVVVVVESAHASTHAERRAVMSRRTLPRADLLKKALRLIPALNRPRLGKKARPVNFRFCHGAAGDRSIRIGHGGLGIVD